MLLYLIKIKWDKVKDIKKGDALAYVVSGVDENDVRHYLEFYVKHGKIWVNPELSECIEIGLANSSDQKIYLGNFQQ